MHSQRPSSERHCCGSAMLAMLAALISAIAAGGCSSYKVPGQAADFRAMGITKERVDELTDVGIAKRLERKPLAGFPTNIAVARVQGNGYRSQTAEGYGDGRYTIVTTRDVESEAAIKKLSSLPMVAGIASLNRLVVPKRIDTEEDLRNAAANVQADMLLIYTFDTTFETQDKIKPLGVITLGLFPDRVARVNSTASAALLDTRNGYIYGLAEGVGNKKNITNAWLTESTLDASRRDAEQQAFDQLVEHLATLWTDVAQRYGPERETVRR